MGCAPYPSKPLLHTAKPCFFLRRTRPFQPLVKKVKGSAREDVDIRRVMAQRADEE